MVESVITPINVLVKSNYFEYQTVSIFQTERFKLDKFSSRLIFLQLKKMFILNSKLKKEKNEVLNSIKSLFFKNFFEKILRQRFLANRSYNY